MIQGRAPIAQRAGDRTQAGLHREAAGLRYAPE